MADTNSAARLSLDPRDEQLFPTLKQWQIERVAAHGRVRRADLNGEFAVPSRTSE